MMLFASIFECLDPVLTIAASLSFKDPFVVPLHRQQEADRVRRRLAGESRSDHLALLRAFDGWREAQRHREDRQYCWDHFLSSNTLQMIANLKRQFLDLLRDSGFVEDERAANTHSDCDRLVLGVLCAGLYPNVIRVEHPHGRKFGQRPPKLFTHEDGRVNLHPKSVICEERFFPTKFLLYHEKVETTQVFIYDASMIPPFPVLFFGGALDVQKDGDQEIIVVAGAGGGQGKRDKAASVGGAGAGAGAGDSGPDGPSSSVAVFQCPAKTADLVTSLRTQLDRLLARKIEQPTLCLTDTAAELLNSIVRLISEEEMSVERFVAGKKLY